MEIPLNQNQEIPKPSPSGYSGASLQLGAASAALALLLVLVGAIEYSLPGTSKDAAVAAAAAAETKESHKALFETLPIGAKSVYVLDASTGEEIYARNEHAQLPLASITKVALALAVTDAFAPEDIIVMPKSTGPGNSEMALLAGQRWSVKDVLDFTLVASSNTGAQILADLADEKLRAEYTNAPQGEATLYRMNALARELGLTQTYFLNVHGLDESTAQAGSYGSARDVAQLFAYAAATNRSVFEKTAQGGLLLTEATGAGETRAFNTNEALGEIPGLVMGKTGFTDLAGGNLGVVFEAGPAHPIVIVVLGSTRDGRFADMRLLVETTLQALGDAS